MAREFGGLASPVSALNPCESRRQPSIEDHDECAQGSAHKTTDKSCTHIDRDEMRGHRTVRSFCCRRHRLGGALIEKIANHCLRRPSSAIAMHSTTAPRQRFIRCGSGVRSETSRCSGSVGEFGAGAVGGSVSRRLGETLATAGHGRIASGDVGYAEGPNAANGGSAMPTVGNRRREPINAGRVKGPAPRLQS